VNSQIVMHAVIHAKQTKYEFNIWQRNLTLLFCCLLSATFLFLQSD